MATERSIIVDYALEVDKVKVILKPVVIMKIAVSMAVFLVNILKSYYQE